MKYLEDSFNVSMFHSKSHPKAGDWDEIFSKPMQWGELRRETGLFEYVCEHGCGHPDPESAKEIADRYGHDIKYWLSHGCCGCCSREDFPGNELLRTES